MGYWRCYNLEIFCGGKIMATRYTSGPRKGRPHKPPMGFDIIRAIYKESVADLPFDDIKDTKKSRRKLWDRITGFWE